MQEPHIKHAIVSVDIVIFKFQDGNIKVGLMEIMNDNYKGMKAVPGGLMNPGENGEEAVLRVIEEKTKVNNKKIYIEELKSYSEVDRDKRGRVVSIAYIGLVKGDGFKVNPFRDDFEFVDISKVKNLAYDHTQMSKDAMNRLKDRFYNSTIAQKLLQNEFTMKEFLDLYKTVLNKEIDKRNFAKKIKALDILQESGGELRGGKFRPAKLFEFKNKTVKNLEVF